MGFWDDTNIQTSSGAQRLADYAYHLSAERKTYCPQYQHMATPLTVPVVQLRGCHPAKQASVKRNRNPGAEYPALYRDPHRRCAAQSAST